MSELVHWNGGLYPMNVVIIRKEGPDLLPGEWEARIPDGAKVIVRESEVEPVFSIKVEVPHSLGGAA